MALISCQRLRIAFGGPLLLDDAGLQVERGERVGLVGRNGEGKSTLLKIITGQLRPDSGEVICDSGTRVSLVEQQVPVGLEGSTLEVIAAGASAAGAEDHHADRLCSLLHLDPWQDFTTLSGGQTRRALLARALVSDPDVLLLDEPTNHLDLDHIDQLEKILMRFHGSVLFITHDRTFLQRVATRIVELDRGRLTSWACDYPTYLARKEELLANEEKEWSQQDQKLAQEEVWVRQGLKARRTRNEGRVRALEQLRKDRAARRERVGRARMTVQEGSRSAAKVVEAKDISFTYPPSDDQAEAEAPLSPVVSRFSGTIHRGDRIGIIGPNGCGKTTLLNLMIGTLEPGTGTVRHGARLELAYFDQHREQLDPAATVADSVGGGNEFITLGDERKHIFAYLQDFLFTKQTARQPVSSLSGGERNRLLLAKLFTQPANVLVLDEPTNDLDTDTLELLEARLLAYRGTVLVVSHDRAFLDNLCTSTLVFEGNGAFREYVGGYSDWQRTVAAREKREAREAREGGASGSEKGRGRGVPPSESGTRKAAGSGAGPARPKRLTHKERQEWTALPGEIEELEQELHELQSQLGDPTFFQGDPDLIRTVSQRVIEIPAAIETAFERWGELDTRA